MALASRILSRSTQLCKFSVDTILPKHRLLTLRCFAQGSDPESLQGSDPESLQGSGPESLQGGPPINVYENFVCRLLPSSNGNKINPAVITQLSSEFAEAGIDGEHWQIYPEPLSGSPKKDEIINYYIKILAQVLGSEEEAVRKIYSVATRERYAFGANVSMEIADKIRDLTDVNFVIGDAYVDPIKKRYPWDPFVNGQALEYDPRYYPRLPERKGCRCTVPARLRGKTG